MSEKTDLTCGALYTSPESIYDKYADFYDVCAASGRADLPLYRELAIGCTTILDVGCGTGRVAIALLEEGHSVVGVDISQRMLDAFASRVDVERRPQLRLLRHEFSVAPLDLQADLVILSWFTFNYLVEEATQLLMLQNLRKTIRFGGKIVLDLFQPKALTSPGCIWEEPEAVISQSPLIRRSDRRTMTDQLEERVQTYSVGNESFVFKSFRYYLSPARIGELLTRAGFSPRWFSFDFGLTRVEVDAATRDASFIVCAEAN
jgi:SAM-dependent methyltransferase